MRGAFERRVDQQATAALPVIQGSSDDFLQECDDRIPRGKAEFKTANALAEGLVEIAIERALIHSSLVAERIIQAGPGDAHLVAQVSNGMGLIPATPDILDLRARHTCS